jgi:hypothetical protein
MKPPGMNAAWLLGAVLALSFGGPAMAQGAPPDIVVTEKDNGKEITLHGKQRLIVRLPSPGGTPYLWSALMRPDFSLVFTKAPALKEAKPPQAKAGERDNPMLGGFHDDVFAFSAASFTETFAEPLTMILCGIQCDPKEPAAKLFKVTVTTRKR